MKTYQTSSHYTVVRLPAGDPLATPRTFVEFMTGAFEDCPKNEQSLWLVSMNPKWRSIARTLLRTGPLVAGMIPPRDLFRVVLNADADAIAIVRDEPASMSS